MQLGRNLKDRLDCIIIINQTGSCTRAALLLLLLPLSLGFLLFLKFKIWMDFEEADKFNCARVYLSSSGELDTVRTLSLITV